MTLKIFAVCGDCGESFLLMTEDKIERGESWIRRAGSQDICASCFEKGGYDSSRPFHFVMLRDHIREFRQPPVEEL
jgi:hypothetical protein